MIKLVASDLDGTIISKDNTICEKNLKAMSDMHQQHVPFAICTGKTYPLVKKECPKLNAQYGIFGNGNHIINLQTGEEIYIKYLPLEKVERVIHIAKENKLHVHAYTKEEIISEELKYMDLRNYQIKVKEDNGELQITIVEDLLGYIKQEEKQVLKIVISDVKDLSSLKQEIEKDIQLTVCRIPKYREYKDYIIDKEYEYLDITPSYVNKNEALTILGNYLHIDKEEMMTIGDNMNDREMIQECGVGIAVANAYDEIKQVANYTTTNTVENRRICRSSISIYKFYLK